jgi:hypothetical protein
MERDVIPLLPTTGRRTGEEEGERSYAGRTMTTRSKGRRRRQRRRVCCMNFILVKY